VSAEIFENLLKFVAKLRKHILRWFVLSADDIIVCGRGASSTC